MEITCRKRPTKAQFREAIIRGIEECIKRELLEAFIKRSHREPTAYPAWKELREEYRQWKVKKYGFDRIGVATEELLNAIESCHINVQGDELRIKLSTDHYSKFNSESRPVSITPSTAVLARYIAAELQRILT
jgi:hypothetical protein